MKTISHLPKALSLALITMALPLALHAEPQPGKDGPRDHRGPACEQGDKRGGPGHDGFGERGARHGKGMHGEGFAQGAQFTPPYLRGIDLTDAQKDKVFAITYAQIPAMRDQGKQRHQAMDELRALSNAPAFDDAKAQQLADKLAGLEKQQVLARVRNEAKILAILTPEQRQKLQDDRKKWEDRKLEDRRGDEKPVNFRGHRSEMPAANLPVVNS